MDALIADGGLRQRDTRFATQAAQHAEAHPYQTPVEASSRFRPEDFTYDPVARTCLRAQCLRTPERTAVRQVAFFHGTAQLLHGADAAADRSPGRTRALCPSLRRGRTCVCEPAAQKARRSLYTAGTGEGGWAMAAVLSRPQHREARPPRIRGVHRVDAGTHRSRRANTARRLMRAKRPQDVALL